MKKLLTILLVLISFSTFAQFEAGEFVNTDTVKIDGVPLLLNTFKKDSLGGAGNIFYSTGASSQPASGSINQVMANNLLNPNTVVKWDGSKFANTGMIEIDGNVGIGTTNPQSLFHVGETNTNTISFGKFTYSSDALAGIKYGEQGLGEKRGTLELQTLHWNSEPYDLTTDMIIYNGNIGIGTTSPSEALDVNGNAIADVLKSRVPTGTPPIQVASTTKVDNLNVELLDGKKASDFQLKSDTSTYDATLSDLADSSAAIRALANTKATISGTDNYIMKKTGVNTLGNSLIQDNGTAISIGLPVQNNNKFQSINNLEAIAPSENGYSEVGAQTFNYWNSPTYTGTLLRQYGSSSAGTVAGITAKNLGALVFQNTDTALIYTNGLAPIIMGTYSSPMSILNVAGNYGVGTLTPTARIHSQSTTTQLRLGYDATKYTDLSTGSTGNLTIDPTGDTVKVVGAVNSTGGFFENGVKITGGGGISNIGITVPTGLTVSPASISVSDTFAISLQSGYSIPTTSDQINWTNAYNKKITTAAFTGTGSTKLLTLTRQDGTYTEAYFTDLGGEWSNDTYGMTYTTGNVGVGTASISGTWFKGGDGTGSKIGVHGASSSSTGVYGTSSTSYGVRGLSVSSDGVYGSSSNRYGVNGASANSYGVYGTSTNSYGGVFEGLGCKATKFYVSTLNTAPASSSATGTTGEIRFTSDYIYVCVATNTWKRTQISTW